MSHDELEAWVKGFDPMAITVRDLGDGRYAYVSRLIYHYTLKVGQIGDEIGYDDRWCYQTLTLANAALKAWNPAIEKEPTGWHRSPHTGRRRPDGNPAKEYIEW